jgi:hypothetical protein
MTRNLALAAAGTLVAGLLTGCGGGGGSDTSSYCDSLKSSKKDFAEFSDGNLTGFEDVIDTFHKLAKQAPDDISTEWATLDGAMVGIEDAVDEAGLALSDLEAIAKGELPEGADIDKLGSLVDGLDKMGSEDVDKAAEAIEKHAKDDCGVDLSDL